MTTTTTAPKTDFASGFVAPSHEQWMGLVAKVLAGADFDRRLVSRTADGIAMQPLYTRADVPARLASNAGRLPAIRDSGWDIRAMHAESDPRMANTAILQDLEGGATSIALTMGHGGLPCDPAILATAVAGVDLSLCRIALVAGEDTVSAAAALARLWDDSAVSAADRRATLGADPLGTLARTGRLDQPIGDAITQAARLARDMRDLPHVSALIADGHPYHAAGASEAQELAAVLSTLVDYLRACESTGMTPTQAMAKLSVGLACDADQLMTIAKLRAARRLLSRIAEACGDASAADRVEIASASAWRMLTRRDPWVNMLRTTVACAAAAIGGADAIVVLPFTWPLGKPDAFARRIARNTQIVLQEEAGLGRVADPAAGSFAIERLTDELAEKAWVLFQAWEGKGGMAAMLTSGQAQAEIAATAAKRAADIASGKAALTGSSAFPRLGDDGVTTSPWPRPSPPTKSPAVTVDPLAMRRLAEPYEALRDAADAHAGKHGARPRIFLANLGSTSEFAARATWITNLLAAGGIEAITNEGFTTSADAGRAFADSGASVACLCGTDATYAALGEATAMTLVQAGARAVLLAGRPGDREPDFRRAGVGDFIFAGTDQITMLTRLHAMLGVASA